MNSRTVCIFGVLVKPEAAGYLLEQLHDLSFCMRVGVPTQSRGSPINGQCSSTT